jgi:hypothetical protein
VSGVFANHHHVSVATDDLALVANLLNARANLHISLLLASCRNFSGRSFSADWGLLVAVDDTAAGQVVGRELHNHAVLGEDSDVVLTHLARNVGKNLVTIGQLNAEHRIRKGFDNRTFDFDDAVFVGHSLVCLASKFYQLVVLEWLA